MAATREPGGVGSELDEALVRAGRHLRRGVVSADLRTLEKAAGREADLPSMTYARWLTVVSPAVAGWPVIVPMTNLPCIGG